MVNFFINWKNEYLAEEYLYLNEEIILSSLPLVILFVLISVIPLTQTKSHTQNLVSFLSYLKPKSLTNPANSTFKIQPKINNFSPLPLLPANPNHRFPSFIFNHLSMLSHILYLLILRNLTFWVVYFFVFSAVLSWIVFLRSL